MSAYDLSTNSWEEMEPMLTKRGRFDVCVVGRTLYAVGGSSGQHETHTAERYDSDSCKWSYVASLPAPISNIGECPLLVLASSLYSVQLFWLAWEIRNVAGGRPVNSLGSDAGEAASF